MSERRKKEAAIAAGAQGAQLSDRRKASTQRSKFRRTVYGIVRVERNDGVIVSSVPE